MTGTLMRGATTARKHIEDFLSAQLPDLIVEARTQWSLEDWQLPLPKRYDAYDPLTISEYPTIGSIVSRTTGWTRNDIDTQAEESYDATYEVRVFIWCRTPDRPDGTWESPEYDSALRVRDDLLALMRTCILTTPSLGKSGVCRVDEGSLAEDYLDAIKSGDQSGRWMVGGTLSFDMQMTESNFVRPLGVANQITVEEDLLIP